MGYALVTPAARKRRIRAVSLKLNEIALVRKQKLDHVWHKAKLLGQPDKDILMCIDELWELEHETEPLRLELIKLIGEDNGKVK